MLRGTDKIIIFSLATVLKISVLIHVSLRELAPAAETGTRRAAKRGVFSLLLGQYSVARREGRDKIRGKSEVSNDAIETFHLDLVLIG
jgi:hypothetical protein